MSQIPQTVTQLIQHFLTTPVAVPRNPITITLDYNALGILCQTCYDLGVRDQTERRDMLNPFKAKQGPGVATRWESMEWSDPHE